MKRRGRRSDAVMVEPTTDMVRGVCVGEVQGIIGVEAAEEELDSGRDTDVMTMCGTP